MNIIKFCKENNLDGINDANSVVAAFREKYISVSYSSPIDEHGVKRTNRRYIFSSVRKNRKNEVDRMCAEANGLILEAPEWKPLVISTYLPKSNIITSNVNRSLRKNLYDVYLIEDGTIVNLYWYEPQQKWTLSTQKGIDVNDTIFSELNFMSMFCESLAKMGINPIEFIQTLDKKTCYTFGFKHRCQHPFDEGTGQPIYKVWFIQMVHIDNLKCSIEVCKQSPWNNIPGHVKIDNITSVGMLFQKLKTAYDDFVENKMVNYGFLLIAKDNGAFSQNLEYNTVILESDLMNYIRNLWYDASYMKYANRREYNRLSTILLNSYLDDSRFEKFSVLFPQYKDRLDGLNKIESNLVDNIYTALTVPGRLPVVVNDSETIVSSLTDEELVIDILCKQVSDLLTITSHERPKQKIRDIIHTNNNLDIFYRLM